MGESYIVYIHTSPTEKRYVGITKQSALSRWKNGEGYRSTPHFYNAITKYGWENFKHEIVTTGLTKLEAGDLEKSLIQFYRSYLPEFGYNVSLGGEFGAKHSAETRQKLSEAAKIRFSQKENRDVMRGIRLGKRQSPEARAKMSAAKKGVPHPMSEDTKQKISEANKEAFATNPRAEEIRQRLRNNGKKNSISVVCFSLEGEKMAEFDSIHDAERATGVRNGNISRCCAKKVKTAGGYRWEYLFREEH